MLRWWKRSFESLMDDRGFKIFFTETDDEDSDNDDDMMITSLKLKNVIFLEINSSLLQEQYLFL